MRNLFYEDFFYGSALVRKNEPVIFDCLGSVIIELVIQLMKFNYFLLLK